MSTMNEQSNLDDIAVQELLNEAKRGAARASTQGALGWQKCPLAPTNKRFLNNMMVNTLHANRIKKEKETRKVYKPSHCEPELNRRSRSPNSRFDTSDDRPRRSELTQKDTLSSGRRQRHSSPKESHRLNEKNKEHFQKKKYNLSDPEGRNKKEK